MKRKCPFWVGRIVAPETRTTYIECFKVALFLSSFGLSREIRASQQVHVADFTNQGFHE